MDNSDFPEISAEEWLQRIKDTATTGQDLQKTTKEPTERQRREIDTVLAIFEKARGDLPEEVRDLTQSRIVGIITYHLRES